MKLLFKKHLILKLLLRLHGELLLLYDLLLSLGLLGRIVLRWVGLSIFTSLLDGCGGLRDQLLELLLLCAHAGPL